MNPTRLSLAAFQPGTFFWCNTWKLAGPHIGLLFPLPHILFSANSTSQNVTHHHCSSTLSTFWFLVFRDLKLLSIGEKKNPVMEIVVDRASEAFLIGVDMLSWVPLLQGILSPNAILDQFYWPCIEKKSSNILQLSANSGNNWSFLWINLYFSFLHTYSLYLLLKNMASG